MITMANWFFGLLLAVDGLVLILLIVAWRADLKETNHIPLNFIEQFRDMLKQRRFKDAFELARNNHSLLARALTMGMAKLQFSLEDAIDEASKMIDSIIEHKRHGINLLMVAAAVSSTVVVVGPILGWHVLLGPPVGVVMTVPTLVFRWSFLGRLSALANDTRMISRDLLREMYTQARSK